MGINTDLNIDPYFDDFDETKQFSRVLFRPARAVQARELTQLQTILQNQVERFGQNVYKEGTIINGVNIFDRQDIYYVKITDTGIADPTLYSQTYTEDGEERNYTLEGQTTRLNARIILGENGFETRDPNLKTFYIVYTDTKVVGAEEKKQFTAGESLKLYDPDGNEVANASITVADVNNPVGSSYGLQTTEGIIFQKGHFLFVEEQFVIISKYSRIPGTVSVGFVIEESVVNSGEDQSLLDNAQGFNNVNAPGADRLKLRPVLTAVASTSEQENFYAIARWKNGKKVGLRDVTEFNVVGDTMARRTYEESGHYTIRGLKVTLEAKGLDTDGNPETYAVISPGKAYAFGHEVLNMSPRKLRLAHESETFTKTFQSVSASYGQYFEVEMDHRDTLNAFNLGNAQLQLYAQNGTTQVGTCFIRSVAPGRIYVFGVEKLAGQENQAIWFINDTPVKTVSGAPKPIQGLRNTALIFNGGNVNTKAVTNVNYTKRMKISLSSGIGVSHDTASDQIIISNTAAYTPSTKNIVLVTNDDEVVEILSTPTENNGNIEINYSNANSVQNPAHVYFDALFTGTAPDTIQQMDVYVKTLYQSGSNFANLGLPNVVKILNVTNLGSDGTGTSDVTGAFKLVSGVKDGYYDKSGMTLKPGATAPAADDTLLVKMTVFRRISNSGNGYLDASSYANVDRNLIRDYSSSEGRTYNLLSSIDFRPYATFQGSYALSANGAESVGTRSALSFPAFLPITDGSVITADIEYYLPRFDAVVIDGSGQFEIIKGEGSENPAPLRLKDVYTLASIYVPGEVTATSGENALALKSRSTRGYTMHDIEQIDKKVERLTDAVTLSLLEASTRSLVIPDASGNDRFKNGILVDGFKNTDIADITDSAYKAAVDKTYRVATPSILQFPIDLDVVPSTSTNVTNWADITTLADSGTPVEMIDQPYGTNVRNAVSNYYNYKGKMQLYPEFDSGYDVIQNPAINIDVDIATPLLDLVDNLQEFIPLTRSRSSSTSSTTRTRGGGGTTVTRSTSTTTVTNSLVGDIVENTQTVGNFVTDIQFNPYLERRLVRIFVTGLRPGTIHHVFFDEENMDQYVTPAVIISNDTMRNGAIGARQVYPIGTQGTTIYSDADGTFACFMEIPAETFYVGEHEVKVADVSQYSSITSGGTSRAKGTYRGYNFDVSQSELEVTTRTVDFDIDETVSTTNNTTSRFIPDPPPPPPDNDDGPQPSCFVAGTIVSLANGEKKKIEDVQLGEKLIGQDGLINTVLEFDHPPLAGRDLYGINDSGPFMTPEHPVYTKEGWKAPRMSDTMTAYPHLESIMVGDLQVGDEILTEHGDYVKVESIECHENEPDQQVYNFILDGNNTYFADGLLVHNRDPLSQTFYVKKGMANGATTIFVRDVDLFFKGRTSTDTTMADVTRNGVTIEIREVINGYPAHSILPFAKKHMTPAQVNVSQDASIATKIVFDNPIRLNIEKEYALVVQPDALDPNYLVYTSKVGNTDLVTGLSVTNDWGDGVLFTSTNNRAWQSYQDEDVKFKINRLEFGTNAGSVDVAPKNMEFFTIGSLIGQFKNDELVYATKSAASYNVAWTPINPKRGVETAPTGYTDNILTSQTVTIPESSINFGQGDYCLITQGTRKHLAKVLTVTFANNTTTLVLDTPPSASLDPVSTAQATIQVVVAGQVTYYNSRRSEFLHVKNSSARETFHFAAADALTGVDSGATATITSVDDIPISYFQPMIYQSNTVRTATEFRFRNDDAAGTFRPIPSTDASYLTNTKRVINSLSNVVDATNTSVTAQGFVIRVAMANNGFTAASPIIDDDLSRVNAYQYQITNDTNTSSAYVSRTVVLEEGIDAVGLKVLLAAYRPPGTMIDVYGRFTYNENSDANSGWIELDQETNGLTTYSSASDIRDYREFEYNLDEVANTSEYTSFQVKIVMRHATSGEITAQGLTVTPDTHTFAHIFDYRAIALT